MKAVKLLSKLVRDRECSNNSCPAIMEADNGDFLVIGLKPSGNEDLNSFAGIANDEQLVIVPREVLLKIKEML